MAREDFKRDDVPVYPIGIVSKLVGVCHATLRIWEQKGLISPARIGKNRYYTEEEVYRLKYIKFLLRDKGMNLAGAKRIIDTTFCWEIKKCKPSVRRKCPVYRKHIAETDSAD